MKDSRQNSVLEFRDVAKIKDAHGLKGELYVVFFTEESDWIDTVTEFRIQNLKRNFTVKSFKAHKDGYILKFQGVDDRNQSEALKGQLLAVPEDTFESREGETIFLEEILGFEVIDQNLGSLGEIIGFGDNGAHDLLLVEIKDRPFEIPFVEEFVLEIDYDSQKIHMNLPEGLIESQYDSN
ncbi:MAG: ribosome maturation factor RimM [Proteobacteria bacterium]|jgi:16S rRNA processing protein RimM|nr:ribosome maturation factor RimM [Pseudomonadota bacterium]